MMKTAAMYAAAGTPSTRARFTLSRYHACVSSAATASRSPSRLAPLVLPALKTNTATAAIVTHISPTCARLSRSPNIGTATIAMSTGHTAAINTAFASDVCWNDANDSVCDTTNARPPTSAAFIHRHVSGAFTSHATTSITGTAIQFRTAAIVRADASIARTNNGATPHRNVTRTTAA